MTSSRRTFIVGLSTAFATMPAALAGAAPLHPVDRAFIAWIGAVSTYNRQEEDPPDGAPDPLWDAVVASENAFYALPVSLMAAAASVLIECSYSGFRGCAPVDSGAIDRTDEDRQRFRVLECLRPHLSGVIAKVAADYLDNPDRPMGESLIWRLRSGEVRI